MTEKPEINITEAQFKRYRNVQIRGRFNMITESIQAASAARLTCNEYLAIINNFGKLLAKFEPDSD